MERSYAQENCDSRDEPFCDRVVIGLFPSLDYCQSKVQWWFIKASNKDIYLVRVGDLIHSLEIIFRSDGYLSLAGDYHFPEIQRISSRGFGWKSLEIKWLRYRHRMDSIMETTIIPRTRILTNWYRVDLLLFFINPIGWSGQLREEYT